LEKGWASLIAVMVFLGGVQLVSIGMLGQYVSRIFEEGKHRPLYLVREDTKADGV
jgi:dolichol-phosphate mannosyltransferase